MGADERKKDIMKHLQTTSDLNLMAKKSREKSIEYSAPETPVTPAIPETPATPAPTPVVGKQSDGRRPCPLGNRQRRIMNHLGLSSVNFDKLSAKSEENKRKKQIEEHLRKSCY
ncbi:MAG: hypothetical protein DSM107014_07235 [Gomphosphaeria aponina SAG 52.96 = DSM 107014]|uniref:Uncharacterized protein n=1 Tax=Gomphosphaeria aponina SAG 52.96 = DSM 107014 TaxID=1521640 RepID=A0A941GPV8_9CHRO|nr:hypothetical protein [Gomphosphaeria aponina SAG 52.96 = DSM 107014]